MKKTLKAISVSVLALTAILVGYKALASTIPVNPSIFETYLAVQMSTTDTSLTIASGALRDGSALSGYACVTIDSNTPTVEYACGTASGTTISNLVRGIDPLTGTTTEAALIFSHRRGADVKITDYPTLAIIGRILNGIDNLAAPISYSNTIATTTLNSNRNYIPSVGLVQDIAFNGAGVINASTASRGVVQIGTQLDAASSTGNGSTGAPDVIPTSVSTSTWNSATAGLRVVVTKNNGKIDDNFISTSTLFTNLALSTSTQIGSFPAYNIGKNVALLSSTGTSSFPIPSGVTKLHIQLVGAGANGAGSCSASSNYCTGAGGGAGAYSEGWIDVTGTTSVQVHVAAVGDNWTTFGTNGFYMSATSGSGQTGGTATGGLLNITGQKGGDGMSSNSSVTFMIPSGIGGSNPLGFGGTGVTTSCGGTKNGYDGVGYGSGASGGAACSTGSASGGNGQTGAILINW